MRWLQHNTSDSAIGDHDGSGYPADNNTDLFCTNCSQSMCDSLAHHSPPTSGRPSPSSLIPTSSTIKPLFPNELPRSLGVADLPARVRHRVSGGWAFVCVGGGGEESGDACPLIVLDIRNTPFSRCQFTYSLRSACVASLRSIRVCLGFRRMRAWTIRRLGYASTSWTCGIRRARPPIVRRASPPRHPKPPTNRNDDCSTQCIENAHAALGV